MALRRGKDEMMRVGRTALCLTVLLCLTTHAAATGPEIRRIAPEQFPAMRLDAAPRTLTAPVEPTLERPFGHCSREQSNWIFCLQAAARASEGRLGDTVDAVARILAAHEGFGPFQRQAFERALREADRRFRALRDHECQSLALSEPDTRGELFEVRLTCQIHRNLERIATLQARYRLPR